MFRADHGDIERSFSSHNMHRDVVDLVSAQQSSNHHPNMIRLPTVNEELFEELLNFGKKPICICGRALQPIKQRHIALYCHTYSNDELIPCCSECGTPFLNENDNSNDNDDMNNNNTDIIWLCPSKHIYPHLFGFFLCKTCCVEQMMSNKWTKQFSSINSLLNFILEELRIEKNEELCSSPSNDSDHSTKIPLKIIKRQHSRHKSTIDMNLKFHRTSDILLLSTKEKRIASALMRERQKALALTFAKIYDLNLYLSLLESVCSEIVSFELGHDLDESYFVHIFKMTSWTEIRSKLHSKRVEWSLTNVLWHFCLSQCLSQSCGKCCGKKGQCFEPNDDDCECCWAKIEFCFMGSIRLFHVPLLFRYCYISLMFGSIYVFFNANSSNNNYKMCVYALIALASVELVIINYVHHFITMFKLKTMIAWEFECTSQSIVTALVIDDLLWLNSPPITGNNICEIVCILRHLLLLHSFKLVVMICVGLLQIECAPNTSLHVIASFTVCVLFIFYCLLVFDSTRKRYGNVMNWRDYKICILGLLSLFVLISTLIAQIGLWFILVLIVYILLIFCVTTLGVSSSLLWLCLSFATHYPYLGTSEHRPIYFLCGSFIGFVIIELETRRIARGLKWNEIKKNEQWVRGGCCSNFWLHFFCAGCSAD